MYTFNITCFVSILQPSMCCFCISNFEQITYWDGIGDTMDKHPQPPSPQGEAFWTTHVPAISLTLWYTVPRASIFHIKLY